MPMDTKLNSVKAFVRFIKKENSVLSSIRNKSSSFKPAMPISEKCNNITVWVVPFFLISLSEGKGRRGWESFKHFYTLSEAWRGVNWADLMAAQGAFGTDFYDRSIRPKHRAYYRSGRPVIKIGPKGALGSHEIRPIHSAPSLGHSIAVLHYLPTKNQYCSMAKTSFFSSTKTWSNI